LQAAFQDLPPKFRQPVTDYVQTFVPERFRQIKFDLFDKGLKPFVRTTANNLIRGKKEGLLFTGEVGVGKTAAMWWLARVYATHLYLTGLQRSSVNLDPEELGEALQFHGLNLDGQDKSLNRQVVFVTSFELVRRLRAYYGNTKPATIGEHGPPTVLTAPFVFIDDIGRDEEDRNGWNKSVQEEYYDERWSWGRPVIATCNFTVKVMREDWEGWERMVDRLLDPVWMVKCEITGASKRTKKFQKKVTV
jgi:DNA replication protein DnaC